MCQWTMDTKLTTAIAKNIYNKFTNNSNDNEAGKMRKINRTDNGKIQKSSNKRYYAFHMLCTRTLHDYSDGEGERKKHLQLFKLFIIIKRIHSESRTFSVGLGSKSRLTGASNSIRGLIENWSHSGRAVQIKK